MHTPPLAKLRHRSVRAGGTALLGITALTAAGACTSAQLRPPSPTQTSAARDAGLPERLSDAEYWKLLSDVSEPGGHFRLEDNYTSNEMEVGQLATALRARHVAGGVYLGVGPEQNFTYIAAIRPRMAFVVDIRRQAVTQHLMYKAMFEMARDRAEFVSLLFARPRPANVDAATPIQRLWELYDAVPSDSAMARANYARVVERITRTHGFPLTAEESAQLRRVFDAFVSYGPGITTRGGPDFRGGGRGFSALTGSSLDSLGQPQSFLSSEENYRFVKSLHERNLIVPVSGDFAGPNAIRAIGAYVAEHGAVVSAFYVSNVEQYLFMDGKQHAFYDNVAALPVDSASVFIRPYSMRRRMGGGDGGATRSLCPIAPFLRAVAAGAVTSNEAALACSL